MSDPAKQLATQLANIEKRTGKTIAELTAIVRASGMTKHGELRDLLKRDLGMGHGDANTVVHVALDAAPAPAAADDVVAGLYGGPKAALRPVHDQLMAAIGRFGEFEVAPKKAYVSLRRKKQFAMIGPATKTQVEVGLNMKGVPATDRLVALPTGGMCNYKVRLATVEEVDAELIAWIKQAYDASA